MFDSLKKKMSKDNVLSVLVKVDSAIDKAEDAYVSACDRAQDVVVTKTVDTASVVVPAVKKKASVVVERVTRREDKERVAAEAVREHAEADQMEIHEYLESHPCTQCDPTCPTYKK